MAAADPLPPQAVPLGNERANVCRVKQREHLDVALLCSKLEAHKREQEARQRHRQERDAERKGIFVPRSAARQFTVTATPMKDDIDWATLRWTGTADASDLYGASGRLAVNPKQLCAAFGMGMTEQEMIAATAAMHQPNLQHSPQASGRQGSQQQDGGNKNVSSQQRSRQGSADVRRASVFEEADPACMGGYKPGDSARRRQMHDKQHEHDISPRGAAGLEAAALSIFHAPNTTMLRPGRDELNEMPYDLQMPEGDDEPNAVATRPKLTPQDRPNWTQQSQCGDDLRHTFRLALRHRKQDGDESGPERRSRSNEATRPKTAQAQMQTQAQAQAADTRRPSDSLVQDAVKLIKREEKRKRHESFKAFFKRS